MGTLYKRFELSGSRFLDIHHDENAGNPRKEWDNLGTMLCMKHRNYELGDEQLNADQLNELSADILSSGGYLLSLYLMDHSGLSISTSDFNCQWDSGPCGFIYVTQEKLEKERLADRSREDICQYLENEVKTYDQYLKGEVFGFNFYKQETCDLGHIHKVEEDSCWGFYGDDFLNNGLVDNLGELMDSDRAIIGRG